MKNESTCPGMWNKAVKSKKLSQQICISKTNLGQASLRVVPIRTNVSMKYAAVKREKIFTVPFPIGRLISKKPDAAQMMKWIVPKQRASLTKDSQSFSCCVIPWRVQAGVNVPSNITRQCQRKSGLLQGIDTHREINGWLFLCSITRIGKCFV